MIRRALITGAGGGIGRAIARRLALEGTDIAMVSRRGKDGLKDAMEDVRSADRLTYPIAADVSQSSGAEEAVNIANRKLDGLDAVIHVAGDYSAKPLTSMTPLEWDAVHASNLDSAFYLSRAAIPHLRQGRSRRIVFFASAGAEHMRGRGTNAAYMIAKSGLIILARSLARELAPDGITVNVVSPGVAESSFEYAPDYAGRPPNLPMGRPAKVEEIADAVWQFVRPEAEYTTGQTIEVAGGWLV